MNVSKFENIWVAVQVRPRHELIVAQLLRYKGYEEFVPTYRSKRQWSDRCKELELPLFTGYIFCKLKSDLGISVMSTPGIIRIVGTKKEIAQIDDREIEALQSAVKGRFPVRPCQFLNSGDKIFIKDGAMAGVEGIIVRHKTGNRLVLSVQLLQRSVEVEIYGAQVEPGE
jgi:transcription termination/antitermination protein NusG